MSPELSQGLGQQYNLGTAYDPNSGNANNVAAGYEAAINNLNFNPAADPQLGAALSTLQGTIPNYNQIFGNAQGTFGEAQNTYNTAGDLYNRAGGLYKAANTPLAAETNLAGLAQNTSGALTPTQQQILSDNAERISDRMASLYSGSGRTGSFGAGIGMTRGIAETNNPLIAQFSQQAIQNALSANSELTQARLGRFGVQTGALGMQGNALGIENAALGMENQSSGLMNAATGGIANVGSQIGQIGEFGANVRQNAMNSLPGMFNLMGAPAQMLQQGGSTAMTVPWQTLRNYSSIIDPVAAMGGSTLGYGLGSTTGSTSTPTPWTTFAGIGLAGAGLLGGLH